MARQIRPKPRLPDAPHLEHEQALQAQGHALVAGVDEAGRGAWAGPVVAGACILPSNADTAQLLCGVTDSKRLSPAQRAALRLRIEAVAIAWGVGAASNSEIDTLGIVPATRLAMQRAIGALAIAPHALVIDAVRLANVLLPQRVFNFADAISLSVAAASILAKTERDQLMCQSARMWPAYGFAAHKGYGTQAHAQSLQTQGACPLHRFSFKPLQLLKTLKPQQPPCQ